MPNFNIKKLADSQVELTVSLDKQDLLGFVSRAEKNLGSKMSVEGFRPGKVPPEIVRQKIGEDGVRQEALDIAVRSSLADAIEQESLDVIEQHDFKIKNNTKDELVYTVLFSVFPDIKLGEYKGLEIKKNEVSVSAGEVKGVVDDILKSRTVLEEVERPAGLGDRVEADFLIRDNGKVIDGGQSSHHPIVLGEGKFVPGFENNIVGMKKGETKNFSLEIPADYYQKSIAGKKLDFQVKLGKVESRTLPEFNDDFVKSLGRFSSVYDLESSIKQGLLSEKEAREHDRVRIAILQKIAENSVFDAPKSLIEKRLDAMITGFDEELHQHGMELGPYLAHLNKTQDDLRREWHDKAEMQVKISLVARAVAHAEDLKVSEGEVNEQLQIILQSMFAGRSGNGPHRDGEIGPEVLENINTDKLRNQIQDTLLNEKVMEFLERNCKFV